jgi:putative hemolysin
VVFGELVPKSLALQFPTQLALWTHPPMRWSLAFFAWFIVVLNGSGWFLMKMLGFGAGGGGHRHIHSPEEIEMLVVESHDGGLLDPKEQRRLRQALRLARRTARELMVPRRFVQMVDLDTPAEELVRIATESPYTRLPVYRGTMDDVLGYMHTRDLAAGYMAHGRVAPEELLHPIQKVPSGMDFERLLPLLRQRGQRLALVLDEFGGVEGIVSLSDVVSELLGHMTDEFAKRGERRPERLPDGRVRLPGTLRLMNAAQWTGVTWHDPEVTTLAGYVLTPFGRIPERGEQLTIDGVQLEVEQVEHNAITSLLVTPRPLEPEVTTG